LGPLGPESHFSLCNGLDCIHLDKIEFHFPECPSFYNLKLLLASEDILLKVWTTEVNQEQ
jgi:hypothetical protein